MALMEQMLIFFFNKIYAVGKALSVALAQKGLSVTVVDYSEERGREVVSLLEKENAKFHPKVQFPSAMFFRCDVTNPSKSSLLSAVIFSILIPNSLFICLNTVKFKNFILAFNCDA